MPFKIDLEPGLTLTIGEVTVKLVAKSGRKARLEIDADRQRFPVKVLNGQNGLNSNQAHECPATKEV